MSINSKMTAIADGIRELSGTTGTMGLDAMATNVGEANTEIGTQADVLAQVVAALEGKAAGGSSGGVKTCSLRLHSNEYLAVVEYTYLHVNDNNEIKTKFVTVGSDQFGIRPYDMTLDNVVCGSIMSVVYSCPYGYKTAEIEGMTNDVSGSYWYPIANIHISATAEPQVSVYLRGDD